MQLNTLELKNFRNHSDLTLEFKPGLNGLVGVNGAGKSSVLEAIQFAFTGEGYKPRDEIVKRGSAGQSLVRATFTLNDQQGSIERHVNASKIIVNYGGKPYSKATEVKELWANLLQIDSHIFKHVIIARQKKVAELLDAESSVREKAFQKIFLVPNTEKLRTTIWDNYIKACPPPFSEEDVAGLRQRITELEAQLVPILDKMERLNNATLTQPELEAVLGSIEHFKKCIRDAQLKPQLELQKKDAEDKLTLLRDKIAALEAALGGIEFDRLQARQKELFQSKSIAILKNQKIAEIAQLKASLVLTNEEAAAIMEKQTNLDQEYKEVEGKVVVAGAELNAAKAQYDKFKGIQGHSSCPTCHQALTDVAAFVEELRKKMIELETLYTKLNQERTSTAKTLGEYNHLFTKWFETNVKIEAMEKELERFKDVDYDATELDQIGNKLAEYTKNLAALNDAKLSQEKLTSEKNLAEAKINALSTYSGTSSVVDELTMMQEVVQVNQQRKDELVELNNQVTRINTEIGLLNTRIEQSKVNHEKNLRRTAYLDKLKEAYELFHITHFPRKLIETYSAEVEAELAIQLDKFNMPYSARIGEGFKVEMVDKEGNLIPDLSGGQEMMVGVCLRLALHSMFAQSFPMLIIDEGTTHLDETNARLYFDFIRDLRSSNVKQLIIIDHNTTLSESVDHIIRI